MAELHHYLIENVSGSQQLIGAMRSYTRRTLIISSIFTLYSYRETVPTQWLHQRRAQRHS